MYHVFEDTLELKKKNSHSFHNISLGVSMISDFQFFGLWTGGEGLHSVPFFYFFNENYEQFY